MGKRGLGAVRGQAGPSCSCEMMEHLPTPSPQLAPPMSPAAWGQGCPAVPHHCSVGGPLPRTHDLPAAGLGLGLRSPCPSAEAAPATGRGSPTEGPLGAVHPQPQPRPWPVPRSSHPHPHPSPGAAPATHPRLRPSSKSPLRNAGPSRCGKGHPHPAWEPRALGQGGPAGSGRPQHRLAAPALHSSL